MANFGVHPLGKLWHSGFARVRCKDCSEEYLLAFSCKGRWFCPSCHSKKVIQFGEFLRHNILYPVPHRQYVFSIPIMLRLYFSWRHSGFSVHNGVRVLRDDEEGREARAQYIIRNKSRGIRKKQGIQRPGEAPQARPEDDLPETHPTGNLHLRAR